MNVKSVEKLEKSQVAVTVEVTAEEFEAAVQKAYLKMRNKISVPGFRPGKAPRKMIEKLYGEGVFYSDAVDAALPDAYTQAIGSSGLDVVGYPEVEIVDDQIGKDGFTFKATVAVYPEVELGQYKGVSAVKEEVKVTADDVKERLNQMAEREARLVSVDRKAKDVSEFETLKELKDDTKAKITAEREQSAKIAFENALLEKVAGDIKADIPEVMIEEQCRRFLDEFKQRLQAQGIPYDQYCKMTGMDEARFMEDGREPAVRQVKMDLAIAAIIKAENLDVTDEEIEEKYKSMAEQYGMELDMLKKYLDAPTVRNQLLNEKAIAVVVDSAKAEKPAKAEKTEGEEEKKPAKKTAKKAAEGEEEKKPAAKKTTKKAAEGEEEKKPAKKTAKKAAEKAE